MTGYSMDNFRIDIVARGRNALAATMSLAFDDGHAIGYRISPEKGLIFLWSLTETREGVMPLPFKMAASGAADFAEAWLAEAEYGPEPDHDGHNTKGWRVYNEAWGHVDNQWGAIVAVQPVWAMHGK